MANKVESFLREASQKHCAECGAPDAPCLRSIDPETGAVTVLCRDCDARDDAESRSGGVLDRLGEFARGLL